MDSWSCILVTHARLNLATSGKYGILNAQYSQSIYRIVMSLKVTAVWSLVQNLDLSDGRPHRI